MSPKPFKVLDFFFFTQLQSQRWWRCYPTPPPNWLICSSIILVHPHRCFNMLTLLSRLAGLTVTPLYPHEWRYFSHDSVICVESTSILPPTVTSLPVFCSSQGPSLWYVKPSKVKAKFGSSSKPTLWKWKHYTENQWKISFTTFTQNQAKVGFRPN